MFILWNVIREDRTKLEYDSSRGAHVSVALDSIRELLDQRDLDGVLLTHPSSVAWLTGGLSPRIDRSSTSDPIWAVVTPSSATLIANAVEVPRLLKEHQDELVYFSAVEEVTWYPQDSYAKAAVRFLSSGRGAFGVDALHVMGTDISRELIARRLAHTPYALERLRDLGVSVATAMETTLRSWTPSEPDLELQGRLCFELERRGVEPVVVLVGGDDRARLFRHPVAMGRSVESYLMVVVVGRQLGLHVAATRFASAKPLTIPEHENFAHLGRIQAKVLANAQRGMIYGALYETLAEGYRSAGHADEWEEHFQGGPVGYQQREFEISPGERSSPWYSQEVDWNHAVAFNPSFAGGFKVEDTYLLGPTRSECITVSSDWPTIAIDDGLTMADVLEV